MLPDTTLPNTGVRDGVEGLGGHFTRRITRQVQGRPLVDP
jgi:hypothetical protein